MDDEKRVEPEAVAEIEIDDLEIDLDEPEAQSVKGGATRVQGNVRWVDEAAQPTQQ